MTDPNDIVERLRKYGFIATREECIDENVRTRVLGHEGAAIHALGQPMPRELFTDDAAQAAWRKTHQTIRTSTAEVARRAFLAAYREAAGPDNGPAIERPLHVAREIGGAA